MRTVSDYDGGASEWRIGDVATDLGIHPSTIRHYEELGLLPVAERTLAGHRLYTAADRTRLRFITQARMLGLTVEEIYALLAPERTGRAPSDNVLALIDRKLADVDQQICMLVTFRQQLCAVRDHAGAAAREDQPPAPVADPMICDDGPTIARNRRG
jgi:DNA-binding transcriptional MerR regulator